ncbi:hypothetical protein Acsp05_09290 [Actinokineospora sp. NBRC 105648]|nr:hypothetical protein Acsp05_09290 [Actinokineospora sp. NBRC 105648]
MDCPRPPGFLVSGNDSDPRPGRGRGPGGIDTPLPGIVRFFASVQRDLHNVETEGITLV